MIKPEAVLNWGQLNGQRTKDAVDNLCCKQIWAEWGNLGDEVFSWINCDWVVAGHGPMVLVMENVGSTITAMMTALMTIETTSPSIGHLKCKGFGLHNLRGESVSASGPCLEDIDLVGREGIDVFRISEWSDEQKPPLCQQLMTVFVFMAFQVAASIFPWLEACLPFSPPHELRSCHRLPLSQSVPESSSEDLFGRLLSWIE